MHRENLLVINPGSTSTKVAIFRNGESIAQKSLSHTTEELSKFKRVTDQFEYREQMILDWLKEENMSIRKPCSSGRLEVVF